MERPNGIRRLEAATVSDGHGLIDPALMGAMPFASVQADNLASAEKVRLRCGLRAGSLALSHRRTTGAAGAVSYPVRPPPLT